MSNLLSGHCKVAVGALVATLAFAMAPAAVQAKRCGVLSNSFHCMTGVKKKTTKKKIRVAAIRPTDTISDAEPAITIGNAVQKKARKAVKKSVRKVRARKKSRKSRRGKNRASLRRLKKRSVRKRKGLRTIGSRYKAKSVRRVTRASLRPTRTTRKRRSKASHKHRKSAKRGNSGKRGWRTRSKGLGFRTARRGISTSCFPARLKRMLRQVSAHFGRKLVITSGYRSHRHNRRIGGARRSQHVHCKAADFYIPGVNKYTLARYLKRLPGRGGVGTYSGNRTVHLDVGPRRTWHWGSKRRRHAKKHRSKRYSSRRRNARRRASRRRSARRLRGTRS